MRDKRWLLVVWEDGICTVGLKGLLGHDKQLRSWYFAAVASAKERSGPIAMIMVVFGIDSG